MKKFRDLRIIIPVIVFIGLIACNINTINDAMAKHQTWRIAVAATSSVMMIIALVVLFIHLSKQQKKGRFNAIKALRYKEQITDATVSLF